MTKTEWKKQINEIERTVTFEMPKWWPPERLDYVKHPGYYPKGHRWEGQCKHGQESYENSACDTIWKIKGVNEICELRGYGWVTFKIPDNVKDKELWIQQTKQKIIKLLNRYKEAKGE